MISFRECFVFLFMADECLFFFSLGSLFLYLFNIALGFHSLRHMIAGFAAALLTIGLYVSLCLLFFFGFFFF